MSSHRLPRLSIVLPVIGRPSLADSAISSLCPPYQECLEPYEVLVVETTSGGGLGEERACAHGDCVRYFDTGGDASLGRAVLVGLRESRAPVVGVFSEMCPVVTPRVVDSALRAAALFDKPLIVLPEYEFEHVAARDVTGGEDAGPVAPPQKKDPYSLFSAAHFGPGNPNGFLGPLLGAACYFAQTETFSAVDIGSIRDDTRVPFRCALYDALGRQRGTRLVVLAGEGAFFRGDALGRVAPLPEGAAAVNREPLVFGYVPGPAQRFLAASAAEAAEHVARSLSRGEPAWFDDPPSPARPHLHQG